PQIASQGFSRKDWAGIDLDIEQSTTLGQRQPTRHWRAVLGVLGGEGGPQLPVTLSASQQTAEQRIPLLRLMTGNADARLGIHRFLEQLSQAREQVGQLGKALFQLGAHLQQVLGYYAA